MMRSRHAKTLRTIPFLIAACLIGLPAKAQYSGGRGVPDDPYQIATAADLIALGETPDDYDKHFILTADIDLDPNLPGLKVFDKAVIAPDTNDVAEGFQGTAFAGVLDGGGHTISNLRIEGGSYLGLLGELRGSVSNLGLAAVEVRGTGNYVGGLAGRSLISAIACCHSAGTVNGDSNVGGLLGGGAAGSVTECWSRGVVVGGSCVGGLVGSAESFPRAHAGTIMDSYSHAAVTATVGDAGGLVGCGVAGVLRCYSTGSVVAGSNGGGLAGAQYSGSVQDCFWDIETSGQATSAGGVGKTTAEMQTAATFIFWGSCVSFWTIEDGQDYPRLAWENKPGQIIPGPTYAGGLGMADDPYLIATVEDLNAMGLYPCQLDRHFRLTADIDLSGHVYDQAPMASFAGVFDGNGHVISGLTITGEGSLGLFGSLQPGSTVKNLAVVDVNVAGSGDYVGALVGQNLGMVTQCRSTGLVRGAGSVGGLVGYNWGIIDRSYCDGSVTGHRDVGGFAGTNAGTVTRCYSTSAVMGKANSVGGLIGHNNGPVAHCYSTGRVAGDYWVGGLVGESGGDVLCSVWDMETSLLSGSAAGVGLTTAEMMDPYLLGLNGFGNDPNWILDAGRDYPHLAWEQTTGDIVPEPDIDWLVGDGTEEAPYRIGTADQLILLGRAGVLCDGHFVLTTDIDLDPNLPDGRVFLRAVIPVFTGVFDGNDHTISHLTIRGGDYLGLFGCLGRFALVESVGVVDVDVAGSGDFVGGLVGWTHNDSDVTQCYSLGTVSGNRHIGGLVGYSHGMVTDCMSGGAVSGTDICVGGLVASNFGTLSRCQSGATVVGADDVVGGLVGQCLGNVTQSRCTGAATGLSGVGGLIGELWAGNVTNCYSTGAVSGTGSVGGLVGFSILCRMTHCYSTGAVTGNGQTTGGLMGTFGGFHVNACFWDTQTSGQATSGCGTAKTTAEMQMQSTFTDAGWDFMGETENGTDDIWWILEGQDYPHLWWERE